MIGAARSSHGKGRVLADGRPVYRRRDAILGFCRQVTIVARQEGSAVMRKTIRILVILLLAAGGLGLLTGGPAFAYVCGPVCANHHCCPPQ